MKQIKILEAVATCTSILGVYLVSDQYYISGWAINGIGDILWMVWGYYKNANYLIALQIILFFIAVNGLANAL